MDPDGFRITSPHEPIQEHLPNVELHLQPWTQTSENVKNHPTSNKGGQTKVPPLKLSHPNSPQNSRQIGFNPSGQATKSQVISGEKSHQQDFSQLPEIQNMNMTQLHPTQLQKWDQTPATYKSNPNMIGLIQKPLDQMAGYAQKNNYVLQTRSNHSGGFSVSGMSLDRHSKQSLHKNSVRQGMRQPRPNSSQTALGKMSNLRYQSQRREMPIVETSNEHLLEALNGRLDSHIEEETDVYPEPVPQIPVRRGQTTQMSRPRPNQRFGQNPPVQFREDINLDNLDLDNLDCSQLVSSQNFSPGLFHHQVPSTTKPMSKSLIKATGQTVMEPHRYQEMQGRPFGPTPQSSVHQRMMAMASSNLFDRQTPFSNPEISKAVDPQTQTSKSQLAVIKEQRQHRLKMQEKAYQNSFAKFTDVRRSHQSKTQILDQDKNFIMKNKMKAGKKHDQKLERLKKLEAQARQLRDASAEGIDNLVQPLGGFQQVQEESKEEVKEEDKEKAIQETENYLHQSIDNFLNESHGMAPKNFKNRTTKVNKALFDQEDVASNKTTEQYKNLKFINQQKKRAQDRVAVGGLKSRSRGLASTSHLKNQRYQSQSQSRSRSRSNERTMIDVGGRKQMNQARSAIGLHHQAQMDLSQSPDNQATSPLLPPKRTFEFRNQKKQRSQTAGGKRQMPFDQHWQQRRKQQSAINQRIVDNVRSSQNLHIQRMSAGKRRGADRIQSSVTTQKIEFKGHKSTQNLDAKTTKMHQIQSQSLLNRNMQFMDESMQDMTSQQYQRSVFDEVNPPRLGKSRSNQQLSSPQTQKKVVQKSGEFQTNMKHPTGTGTSKKPKSQLSLMGKGSVGNDGFSEAKQSSLLPPLNKTASAQSLKKKMPPLKGHGDDYFPGFDQPGQNLRKLKVQDGHRNTQLAKSNLPPRVRSQERKPRGIFRNNTGNIATGFGNISTQRSQLSRRSTDQSQFVFRPLHAQPIYDCDGNLAYHSKHRKPKWVMQAEYDRFMKFEDRSLSEENSRNNRIRMEDPFQRMPHINTVFSHIKDKEIAKYIISSSYLEKGNLDIETEVKMHPDILTMKLFMDEIRMIMGIPKVNITKALAREMAAELFSDFIVENGARDPLLSDLDENLKAWSLWIVHYQKDDMHKDFWKCYLKRKRAKKNLNKLVFVEAFNENSKEWKSNFDPISYQKRLKRYNHAIPDFFMERHLELEEWFKIFQKRAGFDVVWAEMGEPVENQIKEILKKYNIKDIQKKEKDKVDRNQADLDWVLNELKTASYLDLPELEFEPVPQFEQDEYGEFYTDYFNINPQWESRDNLQSKIVKEFKRLEPIITNYELAETSSFRKSADQSDYKARIAFIDSLIASESFGNEIIINDDVYRSKQRRKMQSMLSEQTLHEDPSIDAFRRKGLHPDMYVSIWNNYFSFEKQYLFYYQWYSNYQWAKGNKKLQDCPNYQQLMPLCFTMADRQQETEFARQKVFHPHHFSRRGLNEFIYMPKFTNLRDPETTLLRDKEAFWQGFARFMSKFDGSRLRDGDGDDSTNLSAYLGDNKRDLHKFFFMMDIDFTEDHDIALKDEDPLPKQIDRKYYNLVFRARHHNPAVEEVPVKPVLGSMYPREEQTELLVHPPMEYFEMTYFPAENFQDKEELHEVLVDVLRERKKRDYHRQMKVLGYRMNIRKSKLTRYSNKLSVVKEKYKEDVQKVRRPRRSKSDNSVLVEGLYWKKDKLSEVEEDLLDAHFLGQLYFTDFLYYPERSDGYLNFKEQIEKVFKLPEMIMPHKPYLENMQVGYLIKLVQQYEDQHQTSRPSTTSGRRSQVSPSNKSAQQMQRILNKSLGAQKQRTLAGGGIDSAKSPMMLFKPEDFMQAVQEEEEINPKHPNKDYEVAPYCVDAEIEREKADCPLLFWIEKSIGDFRQKSSAAFLVRPDTSIELGSKKYERNFKEEKKMKLLSKRPQSSKIKMGLDVKFMKTDRFEDQMSTLVDKQGDQPLKSNREQPADFPVLAEKEVSMDPMTTLNNQAIEERSDESDSYSRKIISEMKDVTPKYLPLHIHPDRIKVVYEEFPDEMKATVEAFVKKPQMQTKGVMLNSEELVLTYVDMQVREQLIIAIEEGNLPLIENYIAMFKDSLKSRDDQLNFRSGTIKQKEGEEPEEGRYPLANEKGIPVEGDTILHSALMMNYDTNKPFLDFEAIYQEIEDTLLQRSARPPPVDGTGSSEPHDPEIQEKKLTIKKVKQAISGESERSVGIKKQIVSMLINAGADSSIKNNSGISPNDISKELRSKSIFKSK